MAGSPAPDVVLQLLSCKCPKVCHPVKCECIENGLKCTEACKLQTCSNMAAEDEEDNVNIDTSDDDEEDRVK